MKMTEPWEDFERAIKELRETMFEMRRGIFRRPRDVEEPYTDIIEREKEIEIIADLPGARKEDIEISIDGNVLAISAEVESSAEEKEENYVCRERLYKKFTRRLTLPAEVDIDRASSSFKNGTLRITLPKKESRGRKIKIE